MINVNDALYRALGDLGFSGAMPDRVHKHLGSLGHTGAINDRLKAEGGYKSYVTSIIGGDGRHVYNFDGIDDYVTFPEEVFDGDYACSVKVNTTATAISYVLSSSSVVNNYIRLESSGVARFRKDVDGAVKLVNTSIAVNDGEDHTLYFGVLNNEMYIYADNTAPSTADVTGVTDFSLDVIGRISTFGYFSGVLSDLDIDSQRFYPINDGWAVNPLIVDTIGGQNGTAVNFNEERWGVL